VLDYSSLFINHFFVGVSLPKGCAGLSWGWLGEFCMMYGDHPLVLSNVLQAVLEPAVAAAVLVAVAAPKFCQYNVLCGSFPQARVSGCQSFDYGWCFISAMEEEKRKKEKREKKKKKSL
jgi:hypothetical protein